MKGHIRERSPGHWAIVIDVRDPQSGKRKRRWHSFEGTKREAQVECARLLTEIKNGTSVDPSRMTVAAFLERWIEHMEGQVSPRSRERYAELCRKNIVPLLGGLALTKLQPAHISQAYAKALASGRRDGSGGLSARTVTHCTVSCVRRYSRLCVGRCSRAILPTPLSRPRSSASKCRSLILTMRSS
jgi:Phage integrase, N-terminal SAM-like domain